MIARLALLAAWGLASGLYLYVVASARWRADARRHRHLPSDLPPAEVVQYVAEWAAAGAEDIARTEANR